MGDTGRSVMMFICGLTVGVVLVAAVTHEPRWARKPSVFAARAFLRCMKAPKDLDRYHLWLAEDINERAALCYEDSMSPIADN